MMKLYARIVGTSDGRTVDVEDCRIVHKSRRGTLYAGLKSEATLCPCRIRWTWPTDRGDYALSPCDVPWDMVFNARLRVVAKDAILPWDECDAIRCLPRNIPQALPAGNSQWVDVCWEWRTSWMDGDETHIYEGDLVWWQGARAFVRHDVLRSVWEICDREGQDVSLADFHNECKVIPPNTYTGTRVPEKE